jgi:penicillin G amidase
MVSSNRIARGAAGLVALALAAPGWIRAQGHPTEPAAQQRQTTTLRGLRAPVNVVRDHYGIPHIYAGSPQDAYFALGYLHASDRLFQMEVYRRRGSGTLAEIFGRPLLDDDILVRQIGIRRASEVIWDSPRLSGEVRHEIEAYCAGVNARLEEIGTEGLPPPFAALNLKPARWTPVDALVFARYMGWDQSGTDTDLWMGMLVEKLGLATVNELFPLDRPYEVATIPSLAALLRPEPVARRGAHDAGSFPMLPPGYDRAVLDLHRRFASARLGSAFAFGSNNWVIDGTKSATGKPILANDPHLGFSLPSIWYTAHLVAPGLDVMGVTFAGFPYVVIGHNDRVAWGLTNMQSDAVDYFIEKMDAQHPHQFFYKGTWRPTARLEEDVPVRGERPFHLEIESTMHGPLVTERGATLALDWTGLVPSYEILAFREMNRARNVSDFQHALRDLRVPALNVIYADVDGNIAIAPHGALPIRARGDGRWPVDGSSGDYDWLGFIPDDQLPFALNPPQHFLASANGRPAPAGYPYYLGWMWDPSYRTRRIHELLRTHDHITLADMEAFQTDAHDAAAEAFIPVLLAAFKHHAPADARTRAALDELRHWDFRALPESVAETIWATWFELYRRDVWQDDFDARGVVPWEGGWGFAGSNERQPELEVLEFLTREAPRSPWFDDVRTPERETRDDILVRSFEAAVAKLVKARGPDLKGWTWGKTNVLELHSLAHDPRLDRGGIPVPGDEFTLNPGSNGGPVTGGASWRMLVDFANLEGSVGVYPGGQSEDPASPHYADQMKPWAEGRYLPLYFYSSPKEFRPGETESTLALEPAK